MAAMPGVALRAPPQFRVDLRAVLSRLALSRPGHLRVADRAALERQRRSAPRPASITSTTPERDGAARDHSGALSGMHSSALSVQLLVLEVMSATFHLPSIFFSDHSISRLAASPSAKRLKVAVTSAVSPLTVSASFSVLA